VTETGPGKWRTFPKTLGDTWAATNLSKIDHIVVVMMENRSFDHVLGYRTLLPGGQGGSGLGQELLNFLRAHTRTAGPLSLSNIEVPDNNFAIGSLSLSNIEPNGAGLKTRFPVEVGHELADVAKQLGTKLQMPSGQWIDPALHSEPETDDHPPYADMFLGQHLIKWAYDLFRSQQAVWQKTLQPERGFSPLLTVRRSS
jgi:hypothetical protein